MGLVVFGLVGLLRGLCSAGRLLELGCDGGPGCPVRVAGRLREGAEVNGPLGRVIAVILRLLMAPGALMHAKRFLVIGHTLGKILFRCLAAAVVVAPIVVLLAVLRFGKLPCD